jgi:hypothetical protein
MKKTLIIILAAAMLLSLAACAKAPAPAPTEEPTPAAPAPYAGEDTFVISRDGEDFVIGSAGLGASPKEVCDFYGYELDLSDEQAAARANGPVPPIGGDIRFGMSYAEVFERVTGTKTDVDPAALGATIIPFDSGYVNSYAGALTRLRFQIDPEKDQLYLMGLDFMTDDPAAEWFALLEKFTQAFGEPTTPPRGDYTTPEELTDHLADGKHYAAAAWEGETKGLALMIRPHGSELSVSVEMKWLDLMPGFAASQQG